MICFRFVIYLLINILQNFKQGFITRSVRCVIHIVEFVQKYGDSLRGMMTIPTFLDDNFHKKGDNFHKNATILAKTAKKTWFCLSWPISQAVWVSGTVQNEPEYLIAPQGPSLGKGCSMGSSENPMLSTSKGAHCPSAFMAGIRKVCPAMRQASGLMLRSIGVRGDHSASKSTLNGSPFVWSTTFCVPIP